MFRHALARADGDEAWIRMAPRLLAAAPGPRDSFEVLVTQRGFASSIAAIRREADRQRLEPVFDPLAARDGLHAFNVTLLSGRKPVCRFELKETRELARIAIVIDDLGQNAASERALLGTHAQLTFSVIPRLPYSRATAAAAHGAGFEVMLHLPMQPLDDKRPDVSPDELRDGMNAKQVVRAISRDLASVPYVSGVNNHMGSRATADPELMTEVMAVLGRDHLYFIDSRTTAASVALGAARRAGVPAFYRSVFLDDVHTVPYTLGQLRKLCAIADREGAALAIGHPYPTTIDALRRFLPKLEEEDIQLVPASRLAHSPLSRATASYSAVM